MDLYCPRCAEPWDNDTLHDVAGELGSSYRAVAADFRRRGCAALGERCGELAPASARAVIAAAYELGGDDMDGAMSDLEDWLS
jgi:hypothetical protein